MLTFSYFSEDRELFCGFFLKTAGFHQLPTLTSILPALKILFRAFCLIVINKYILLSLSLDNLIMEVKVHHPAERKNSEVEMLSQDYLHGKI